MVGSGASCGVGWCCTPAATVDEHFRLLQRVEDLPVQQLVPELAVEAPVVAVLPRAARLDKEGDYIQYLEILDDRYARRATLLASQLPVEHWHDVVGDPTFGDPILDRLLNNAHRITLETGSMRRLYDSTKTNPNP